MKWKRATPSNMFWRNMVSDFLGRTAYSTNPAKFNHYFQYKIGKYCQDEYLYFPKEPYYLRYKNEIFNKLNEYTGFDIIKYLEFHFDAYPNRQDFLRFLYYEISARLLNKIQESRRAKYKTALTWVTEKEQEIQQLQEEQLRQQIEQGVQEIIQKQETASPSETDQQIKNLSEKLSTHIDQVMGETEKGIRELTGSFTTGNIELNNHNHEEKIIQLFILLQQVQAPSQLARAEQLFKKFTASDIAAILHLHFEAFQDNKLNTLQRKVGDQVDRIKPNQPKIKKLSEALEEFFYQ